MSNMIVKLSDLIAPVFWPVHNSIKGHKYTHYWLPGGRASAKSSYVSVEIITGIMRSKEANAIVYRKVANTLKNSVVSQCRWAIDMLGVSKYWEYHKSPYELIYKPTGQRVLFSGADDPEKSKGIKLAHGYFAYVWFEELTEFSGLDEIETIIRSLMRGNYHTSVIYTYNPPKSINNWVNAECLIPHSNRLIKRSTYLDVPQDWLGEQFLAEARATESQNPLKYRWAYLGEATGTGGTVFDNLTLREITQEERKHFSKLHDGLDVGYATDPNAYVVNNYEASLKKLYIFDEFYGQHASYDRLAEEIRKRNANRRIVIIDSADGGRSVDELNSRNVRATGARKGPGSVEHGIHWLQDLNEIIIDPVTCPNTAREFSGYEYELDRWGNFKASFPDADNHSIDATRYSLEPVSGSGVQVKLFKGGL
ncbi:MAG: PBSX family phage terminase large subunit [Clostridiales bacterium]|jgi:PBSX family phage terminase large subunit|nr:PBSX family phage terminase large subunit [Clostridiales bacterium]MCI1951487.1 PBSX family phage terminase large subunit [Clostridiales bacterium]MCI1960616.1 PBSX family phage terminase large subunit [Clostridiales bacterium]MCI1960662.1 PBSX family phage terminase large subunit [Clostridiales bacterium]MCI2021103.1 PBSX family phage terminase large subunit [Clostridiales bacterium]